MLVTFEVVFRKGFEIQLSPASAALICIDG